MTTTMAPEKVAMPTASPSYETPVRPGQIAIHRVLVPIDFSPASLETLEYALPLLNSFGAELHLVHVSEPEYPLLGLAAMTLAVHPTEVRHRVRQHLKRVATKYSLRLRPENIHVARGRPFEEICRLAADYATDLMIISTHGNTGFRHLALGSTAERLVRYSPCPVLVLPPRDRTGKADLKKRAIGPVLGYRKILVPVDFSECSMKGVAYAESLARYCRAKLVLLHSIALQYYLVSDEYARYDLPSIMQQSEKAAASQMRELVTQTQWHGTEVKSSLCIGHAGEQICEHAKECDADLIVTSTHGTTGFKHVLAGSTAEYIVQHARRPVLVVPTRDYPAFISPERA